MTALDIPIVDPMMVRRFTPLTPVGVFGGIAVIEKFDIEDIGLVDQRLDFDEDVVDCSHRIFEITNWMLMLETPVSFCCSPSRRWRNLRNGMEIERVPDEQTPLLYIGNPVRLVWEDGLTAVRSSEFLVKSGVQLGH